MKLFRRKPIILECPRGLIDKERRKLEAELSFKLKRTVTILPDGMRLV